MSPNQHTVGDAELRDCMGSTGGEGEHGAGDLGAGEVGAIPSPK